MKMNLSRVLSGIVFCLIILLSGCTDSTSVKIPVYQVIEADFLTNLQTIENVTLVSSSDPDFDFSESWGTVSGLLTKAKNKLDFSLTENGNSITMKKFMGDLISELASDVISVVFKAGFYFYVSGEFQEITLSGQTIRIPKDELEFYFGLAILFTPSELKKEITETFNNWLGVLKRGLPLSQVETPIDPYYVLKIFVKDSGIDIPLLENDTLILLYPTTGGAPSTVDLGNMENIESFYNVIPKNG